MAVTRMLMRGDSPAVRLVGAGIAGIGLTLLVQQIVPGV
jgi:hypothetical protein